MKTQGRLTCRGFFTPEVRDRLLWGAAVQPDAKLLWTQRRQRCHGAEPIFGGREVDVNTSDSLLPTSREGAKHVQSTHLVGLNLCDQVFERGETAQPHDGLGLLHGQALDLGRGASAQDDLLPSQEVLEFGVVGGLPGKGAMS